MSTRIRRFTTAQRAFHLLLMLTFLVQAATGLARMFIETNWGKWLASVFGGYEMALSVHKGIGLFMIALFVVHVVYALLRVARRPGALFGPDSMLPRWRDVVQFVQHTGWMLGIARHPKFDRYGYWEKFDYWAVFWGMVIIGVTGLILYSPLASSRYMPGWGINVALWVHRIEAVLAIGHVFVIHFFVAHLRRSNFPMDETMFQGSVDMEKARHERPAWIERLSDSGELSRVTVDAPPMAVRVTGYVVGVTAVIVGVLLLIYAIRNIAYVTW